VNIEEILSRLERIDHKEYSSGFEFADSSTFDEMSRCFKERKILSKEIERLNNILKMLKDKLDFAKRQEEEKLNRIERCMAYNKYILHESWYGGNEKKYAQRNIDILIGKETELKEIPRVGSDKE
jgi:hypothetical protein